MPFGLTNFPNLQQAAQRGGLTQSTVPTKIPQNLGGIGGNGFYQGTPYGGESAGQATNNGATAATAMSNSDAFFSSANAPLKHGTVSVMPGGQHFGALPNPTNPQNGMNGNSGLLNQLIASMKSSSQASNDDSLARYKSLMDSVKNTSGTVNGLLNQLGKTGETRIAQNEAKNAGAMTQSLISRGLGNTTIQDTSLRGVHTDAENARQSLGESIASQKIGTEMNLGQMYGDALLSRQNQDPTQMMLQLIQSLAGR